MSNIKNVYACGSNNNGMLHIIFGNQRDRLLQELTNRMDGDTYEVIDQESFDEERIMQTLKSENLFEKKSEQFALYGITAFPEGKEWFLENASALNESAHRYVLVEDVFPAPLRKKMDTLGISYNEYRVSHKKGDDFDMFQFGNTFAARDKKRLWILLHEAYAVGKDAQDVHNILWWQIKNMNLVMVSKDNPGLHPFVYQKTKQSLSKYSPEELQGYMKQYLTMFHEARLGKQSLEDALEHYIISL